MQLAGPGVFGPPHDRATAIEVLRTAAELGVNHIDTADAYGPYITNEIIREALFPYGDHVHIVNRAVRTRGPAPGLAGVQGCRSHPWMCSMPARAAPGYDMVESGLSALQSAGHMPMCRAARLDRAGRSRANRCRRRPWRCEPFRSSCGRDRMRAGPHRGPCLRCAGTPSTSCFRRGRQVLALW